MSYAGMYPWCPDCEGRGALPCTVCVGGHADCERCEGTDMEACVQCERLSVLFRGEPMQDVVAMAKELMALRLSAKPSRFVVTTGGTYIGSVDVDAALRQLEIERDEAAREVVEYKDGYFKLRVALLRAERERDEARADLAARVADYQELGERLDKALSERDAHGATICRLQAQIDGALP